MTSVYDWRLVALSILVAMLTSYTALDLAGRVTAAQGRLRKAWQAAGAVTMGVGIWSMHFIAMLAFSLPIPITYYVPTVLASMLVAVIASGTALLVVSRRAMGRVQLLAGGVFMGLAIAAMHYLGMAAMRMQAITRYDSTLVGLSVLIAIGASLSALWLAFQFRAEPVVPWSWQKIGSAIVMGAAIAGMHYTAMAAVSFTAADVSQANLGQAIDPPVLGAVAIAVTTLLVLGLTLLTSFIDQRFAHALRQSEARIRSLYETGQALVSNLEIEPLLQNITDAARKLLKARIDGLLVLGEGPGVYEYIKVSGWPRSFPLLSEVTEIVSMPCKEGICLRVEDITTHPRWVTPSDDSPSVKAFMCVPLQVKDHILGSLFVGKGPQDGDFSHDDEDLLLAFANQAAIALENARLYERQKQALIRMQQLSHKLDEAQASRLLTEERNRIAEELHDQVAQVLFGIGLKATWCLERTTPESEVRHGLEMIRRSAAESTAHIRDAIYRLSRSGKGEGNLLSSLRSLVCEFKESSGIDSDLVIVGEPVPLSQKAEEVLCRVIKEALANVVRHSRAKVAIVSLRFSFDAITLVVQDDGIGLPGHVLETYWDSLTHFGLKGMRRRIEELGGQFFIRNGDEAGLIITATVPLNGVK